MEKERSVTRELHEAEGRDKIDKLRTKMDITQHNIEVSEEIIAAAPSDAQREKLIEKNGQRRRAVGSIRKEIRDTQQTLEKRSHERST